MTTRAAFLLASLGWGMLLASGSAQAYVRSRSPQSGASVRWPAGANVVFRANPNNSSGLSPQDFFSIVSASVQRWIQAGQGGLSFTYFQGGDPARYPSRLGEPQDNSIFFTSQAAGSESLPCNIIGLTEFWFDQSSGQLQRADMRLNDNCYKFTANPAHTAASNSSVYYLGDIVAHELGHAFGLEHSQNAQSTMFYRAAKQMHKPSCDDEAAMLSAYAPGGLNRSGAITGRVLAGGSAVFGAVVNAIELTRGINIAHAISDKDGSYRIEGLEPGVYALLIEPYFPGASSLGAYYAGIQNAVCSGFPFQRTFLVDDDGSLARAWVGAGSTTDFGAQTVGCDPPASPFEGLENSIATAPDLALDAMGTTAAMGVFSSSADHYYRVRGAVGALKASALAYTLYSRADMQVEFLDSTGRAIAVQTARGNVFTSASSGYTNFDASSVVTLTHPQDVYIHAFYRANTPAAAFPGGGQGLSSVPYYAIAVSSNAAAATNLYADNARCERNDPFSVYSQPGDPAPYRFGDSGGDASKSSAGCGTIRDDNGSGPGGIFRLANFAALACLLAAARRKMAVPSI